MGGAGRSEATRGRSRPIPEKRVEARLSSEILEVPKEWRGEARRAKEKAGGECSDAEMVDSVRIEGEATVARRQMPSVAQAEGEGGAILFVGEDRAMFQQLSPPRNG